MKLNSFLGVAVLFGATAISPIFTPNKASADDMDARIESG